MYFTDIFHKYLSSLLYACTRKTLIINSQALVGNEKVNGLGVMVFNATFDNISDLSQVTDKFYHILL